MFILPTGHESFVLRRLPWLTITIAIACLAMQIRASLSEGDLVEKANSIAREIQRLEGEILHRYAKHDDMEVEDLLKLLASMKDMQMPDEKTLRDFRAGKLSAPNDPMLLQLRELEHKMEEVKNRIPAIQLGYRPATDHRLRMLTSAFAHAGWFHLLSNMWFLYLVGCNLEDRWGHVRFLVFYLAGAMVSAFAFGMLHPESTTPLVGASGAIAAAMGAFLICFAATKIHFFYFYWFTLVPRWGTFQARALWVLPLWVIVEALQALLFESDSGGVAYSAHVSGFIMGAAVTLLIKLTGLDQKLEEAADQGQVVWSENPLFVEAMQLSASGQKKEASVKLSELIAQDPGHQQGHEEMLSLALELGDAEALRRSATWIIRNLYINKQYDRVVDTYRSIKRASRECEPEDRALLQVVRAARDTGDAQLVVEATKNMMDRFPDSKLIPRAMWDTAEVQHSHGHGHLARKTLQSIVDRYPTDPFADKAKKRLGTVGA